nr:NAD-dependent epimerase/dehydratase family protein [uncultured Sulfurimonas sp.]
MAKILITGIAGFIGSALAQKLSETDDEVIGIDNLNSYYDVTLKHSRMKNLGFELDNIDENKVVISTKYKNLSFLKTDITNLSDMEEIFKTYNFEYVIHLAAQAGIRYSFKYPETYVNVNIVGTFNIFELSKKYDVKHLLYASSSSVYGDTDEEILSVDMKCDTPLNMYAASKKSNELMAHSYASLNKMNITGLRFFTVYGPWGRPDMAPMIFADAITSESTINLFNKGDMYRDFTYIDDIVDGIVLIIKSDLEENYNIFNIGNSAPVNMKDFVNIMQDKFQKEADIKYLPMQKGEVYKTYADISKMKEHFNFSPKTDIKEGIEKFVSWYCQYYGIDRCAGL